MSYHITCHIVETYDPAHALHTATGASAITLTATACAPPNLHCEVRTRHIYAALFAFTPSALCTAEARRIALRDDIYWSNIAYS